MRTTIAVAFILATSSSAFASDRCDPCGHRFADFGNEHTPRIDGCSVVVATVRAVDGDGATNANPPRVTLQVDEVLSGDLARGTHELPWAAHLHLQCGTGEEERIRRWKETPNPGPPVGSRFILLIGKAHNGTMEIAPMRYAYDEAERRLMIAAIADAKKKRPRR